MTLASSSAASNYAALCAELGVDPKGVPCAVIGPATREDRRGARTAGGRQADVYTLEGLMVAALEEHF